MVRCLRASVSRRSASASVTSPRASRMCARLLLAASVSGWSGPQRVGCLLDQASLQELGLGALVEVEEVQRERGLCGERVGMTIAQRALASLQRLLALELQGVECESPPRARRSFRLFIVRGAFRHR